MSSHLPSVIAPLRKLIALLKKSDDIFQNIAIRSMKSLGRSRVPIHPKHLYDNKRTSILYEQATQFSPGVFVDLGCGSGSDVKKLSLLGWRSIGIDYTEDNLNSSTRLNDSLDSKTSIFNHNLEFTPYPVESATAQVVSFINVIEHLHNRQGALQEIHRILAPDGICIISAPNSDTFWKRLQRFVGIDSRDDIDHKIEYTKSELLNEIDSSNLRLISPLIGTVPSFPFHGILALTAVIHPTLYRASQKFKYFLVKCSLVDTVGWIFIVDKKKT
tara:strand:- start:720 stop:1538 length:819 start_codon:yes stop_codon:yes gene_type:complete